MSDMDARDDGLLDGSLSSYYHELADASVPVKLHARIVSTIQARGETRVAGRGLRHDLARLAPAALVVCVIAAVALAALPWAQLGPLGPGGPTASATTPASPTAIPTPFPLGAMRITAVNLGAKLMTVTIGGQVVGRLACGQTGTYAVTTFPSKVEVAVGQGTSDSVVFTHYSEPMWWIYGPDGLTTGEEAPPANRSYAVCPTAFQGRDPSGVATWDFYYPTVSGTAGGKAADARINQAISAAAEQWAVQLAADLATLRQQGMPPMGYGQLFGSWTADTSMPGLLSISVRMDPVLYPAPTERIPEWTADLMFDLSDGHRVGVDELFTDPAYGLAVLSAQTRQLMGLPADGGAYAAATAPDALLAAMWYSSCDGLHLVFQDPSRASEPAASLYQKEVVIPWSALLGLSKPDSPFWPLIECETSPPSPQP